MRKRRPEALAAYHFAIEIDGIECGRFRSCSGLKSESEVVSLREGGQNEFEHRLVGANRYGNIILKQGFSDMRLFRQRLEFGRGKIKRFNGTIVQLGSGGKAAARWTFKEGWICKWDGPDFDAVKNEISIETIEIVHHGFKVDEAIEKQVATPTTHRAGTLGSKPEMGAFGRQSFGTDKMSASAQTPPPGSIEVGMDRFGSSKNEVRKYGTAIEVVGDKRYYDAVVNALDELKKTPSGAIILGVLEEKARGGRKTTISFGGDGINDARASGVDAFPESVYVSGMHRISATREGAGCDTSVRFDPEYFPAYSNGTPCTTPALTLGHELIHAMHNAQGVNLKLAPDQSDPYEPVKEVRPSGFTIVHIIHSNHEESRTIGRGGYSDEYPTENSLRQEMGIPPPRESHGRLCTPYVDAKGNNITGEI